MLAMMRRNYTPPKLSSVCVPLVPLSVMKDIIGCLSAREAAHLGFVHATEDSLFVMLFHGLYLMTFYDIIDILLNNFLIDIH